VTVFPIGSLNHAYASTIKVKIDRDRLKKTLTTKNTELTLGDSIDSASMKHGALYCAENCGDGSPNDRMYYNFTPNMAGCSYLAVVIWDCANTKIVGSWLEPLNVLPKPGQRASDSECKSPTKISQRFEISTFPQFELQSNSIDLSARLTFVDFEIKDSPQGFTMGFFEDLRGNGADNQVWILETDNGLRRDLADIKIFVDEGTDSKTLNFPTSNTVNSCDMQEVFKKLESQTSQKIERKLFRCQNQNDDDCPGWRAHKTLMKIASNTVGEKLRIQVTFRDTHGSLYYLPIHLLRIDKDKNRLLPDAIRIDQPLPMPLGEAPQHRPCVDNWLAGLIVQDEKETFDDDHWREEWGEDLKNCKYFLDLTELQKYFRGEYPYIPETFSAPGVPEGLVLLAHHGASGITERQIHPEDKIGSESIKRRFGSGSLAVFAACSVGAMDMGEHDNSLLLHTLNEKNIRAAIVSPFNVPAPVIEASILFNLLLDILADRRLIGTYS
jgi:hypothetical protein